jgi:hypothetical protein
MEVMNFILFCLLLLSSTVYAKVSLDAKPSATGHFAGRISRISENAGLLRVKVDFENFKYINVKDRVEFYSEMDPNKKCLSFVESRSSEYMLLKIPEYGECVKKVFLTVGSYVHLYSPDLQNSIRVGEELVKILLKKRLALDARMVRLQKELDIHPDKVEAVNKRYEILKQKMELEWFKELSALEEDKTKTFKDFKQTEARKDEVDHKLQVYKVKDSNFTKDRWSLDPELYVEK